MELEYNHDHSVYALQTLSFKDIPCDTRERIKTMFEIGYTPGLAYKEVYKSMTMQASDEIQFHLLTADRSKVALRRDFNSLYTEYKKERFGSKDLNSMFSVLNQKVKNLQQIDGYSIKFQPFNAYENDPFISAIVSPLVKRFIK